MSDSERDPEGDPVGDLSLPRPTTFVRAPRLSTALGTDLTIASESLQETGSFKFRAAWNVVHGSPNELYVTVSSGNFGQALARATALAGKRAIVAMPAQSAQVKVEAVRSWGAEVDLIDTAKVSRSERLAQLAAAHPEAYVASPYDDPLVIAGNASLGREIAAAFRDERLDAVLVPIGGGGLAAGVVQGLAEGGCGAEVWACEPLLANDAARSLRSGKIESNASEPATIADGARTPSVGKHNWPILRDGLAGVIEVPEAAIREGVRLLFALANLKAEPTGALPIGALLAAPDRFRGRRVVAIVSGGNVDPAVYRELIG
jgi:threonine dehydratase